MLSGADIAAIISSSPETVSRFIADLKRKGVLEKLAPGRYRGNQAILEGMLTEEALSSLRWQDSAL
jgi:predicted transcriptional regulator of viral defense system